MSKKYRILTDPQSPNNVSNLRITGLRLASKHVQTRFWVPVTSKYSRFDREANDIGSRVIFVLASLSDCRCGKLWMAPAEIVLKGLLFSVKISMLEFSGKLVSLSCVIRLL